MSYEDREYGDTEKQREICMHILAHKGPLPFEDLKKLVSWKCSGPALQCSVRVLARHEFLTRIYGTKKRLYLVPEKKMKDRYGA